MKRIVILLLVLVLCCSLFASCDMLPEGVTDLLEKVGVTKSEEEPAVEHTHNFVLQEADSKEAKCEKEGYAVYKCDCGEEKKETLPALGHSYEVIAHTAPSCGKTGSNKLKCSTCNGTKTERIAATGNHTYDETTEASRILKCTGVSCNSVKVREYNGKYKDIIVYSFSEADLEAFDRMYNELDAIIDAAEKYDATKHQYNTSGTLYEDYLVMEAKYDELYDFIEYVTGQYQIAQVEYHMNINNEEKQATFDYISELRTDLIDRFYSFSKPLYDSMYREFYYHGMTDQEIQAFLYESDTVGDEEYKALVKANTDLELEYDGILDPVNSPRVPSLYAEFVANNNAIARKLGYSNYLEYAYENIYDRDYSPEDVAQVVEYVKQYIVPALKALNANWDALLNSGKLTQTDVDIYYSQVLYSFFTNYDSNIPLNDYIDLLSFTSNPDKQMSFSDELNSLIEDGNYFRGNYEGAYVTYLYGVNTPIAYFGPSYVMDSDNYMSYDSPFTVVHEFGHYMNEKYNDNQYSQSYDLLEMHSQGNEMLYLAYLNGNVGKTGFQLCEGQTMISTLSIIVNALVVDTFEQAIYTDNYTGSGSAQIMADGTITADEYDALYNAIISDFDATGYATPGYWRYVTVHAPCYYVSYSISALSVLQLYPMANENFDAAVDSYLKLFTYTDEMNAEEMSVEEILAYAGLYSFTDEELYKSIASYFGVE